MSLTACVVVGGGEACAFENLRIPLGKLSVAESTARLRDGGTSSVGGRTWLGDMVAVEAGHSDGCTFNNGNMHFTNERINSREMIFLATVALCFKGVCFI